MYGSEMSFYDYLVQLGLEEPEKARKTTIEIEKDRKEKAEQAIAKAEAIVEKIRRRGGESC